MLSLKQLPDLIQDDLSQVNQIIHEAITSRVNLVTELSEHLINSGGKRLRPLIVLFSAHMLGYQGNKHLALAAIMEMVHTATLLHDDVVDGSALRRGKATANALWGNQSSVLVGDYLYSRVFQLMLGLRDFELLDILADTTNAMVSGELQQLSNQHNPDITEEDYLGVIYYKTAKLFETAAKSASMLNNASSNYIVNMTEFGKNFGMVFQLVDDVLDYHGDKEKIGKNIGDDFAEGKMTLPLIYTLQNTTEEKKKLIRHAIVDGKGEHLEEIYQTILDAKAIDYTKNQAKMYSGKAIKALQPLPDSIYKDYLIELTRSTVERTY